MKLAHYRQKLLGTDTFTTIAEIAKAEGLDATQVRRVMRLALLAREVLEWLVGSPDAVLEQVMRRKWADDWHRQMQKMWLADQSQQTD